MLVLLATARVLGATADLALIARGHVIEAAVAAPALLCLAVAWRHRTWSGGP